MKIFIDTNVLLDFLLRRKPFYGHAAWLFERIEREGHEAYISAISFNNVFYISSKSVGTNRAKLLVRDLRKLCKTIPLDELVIDQALMVTIDDFEDAIQAVSAGRVNTPYIVTRNARDFQNTKLIAYSPEEMLALMEGDISTERS